MKKETVYLLLFLGGVMVIGYFVIKTLKEYDYAIKVSKGEIPVK